MIKCLFVCFYVASSTHRTGEESQSITLVGNTWWNCTLTASQERCLTTLTPTSSNKLQGFFSIVWRWTGSELYCHSSGVCFSVRWLLTISSRWIAMASCFAPTPVIAMNFGCRSLRRLTWRSWEDTISQAPILWVTSDSDASLNKTFLSPKLMSFLQKNMKGCTDITIFMLWLMVNGKNNHIFYSGFFDEYKVQENSVYLK